MKKILLFLGMFLFITNVNALTFDVNITNIEDEGSNTLGTISNIDLDNKTIDAYFQDIGDEVNFSVTITNNGDRAGTLKSINVTSTNNKMEYTSNLPSNGLAINGNDTNTVTITGRVLQGATKGNSTSTIKITYNYDEGSCPEGEILSADESMCSCPEGKERNEHGVCVVPETKVTCEADEIYNETKKICEKKVVPVPSNPKTLDNIVLITLLFIVSGLGIYAVMYKRLNTNKKKVTVGVVTGVITLSLSFSVLAGVYGIDKLLGAIINPITKNKELVITVNENLDLIEVWDGNCDLSVSNLTPANIFDGGSGTLEDPYQVKTAEQLSCFAKSVNNGTTYDGKYIIQTKNIKLNETLNGENANLNSAHVWTSAGDKLLDMHFDGSYDGDDYKISGLYITDASSSADQGQYAYQRNYKGLFGYTSNAGISNVVLTDVYMNTSYNTGALIGYATNSLTIYNVTTYGTGQTTSASAGVVAYFNGNNYGYINIINTTNNINMTGTGTVCGIIYWIDNVPSSVNFTDDINNGSVTTSDYAAYTAGVAGYINASNASVTLTRVVNNGAITIGGGSQSGGVVGSASASNFILSKVGNTGNISLLNETGGHIGGVTGHASGRVVVSDNCYNSGNITHSIVYPGISDLDALNVTVESYVAGIFGFAEASSSMTVVSSYNTGAINGPFAYCAGLVGKGTGTLVYSYNLGQITGYEYTGGLVAYFSGGLVTSSYNKGNITVFGGPRAGGLVGWGDCNGISVSYNEGDIYVPAINGNLIGGLCASNCGNITNSYNRGNVTSKYSGQMAGIATNTTKIENVYNSGDITFEGKASPDGRRQNVNVAGISYNSGTTFNRQYNLGNITVNLDGVELDGGINVAGINSLSSAITNKSVNKGELTINIKSPVAEYGVNFSGISTNAATDSFNAGTMTFNDTLAPYSGSKKIGQISAEYGSASTGNYWNTDPNGKAIGCIGIYSSCTVEASNNVGSYTTDSEPDILSIINGDDAFEIKQGDTLPTLKVFNN